MEGEQLGARGLEGKADMSWFAEAGKKARLTRTPGRMGEAENTEGTASSPTGGREREMGAQIHTDHSSAAW